MMVEDRADLRAMEAEFQPKVLVALSQIQYGIMFGYQEGKPIDFIEYGR